MQNPIADIIADYPYVGIRWEVEGGYHREVRRPGADLTDLPQELQDAIQAHWTAEMVQKAGDLEAAADEAVVVPVPTLTPRQLRLMLINLGIYEETIVGLINAIQDTTERAKALTEWNWATRYERDHPLVNQLAAALGIDGTTLDGHWQTASTL